MLPFDASLTLSPNSGSTCSSYSECIGGYGSSSDENGEDDEENNKCDESFFPESSSQILYTKYYFPKQQSRKP